MNKKILKPFLLMLFIVCARTAYTQSALKLWYKKPAANWNEALAIGNGRLAGMVFGSPDQEQIQLNEETVWAGGPHNNVNPDAKSVIPILRQLISEKNYVEAQSLANKKMYSKQNGMPYQTVGSLFIDFPKQNQISNYYRELDLSTAICNVSYEINGTRFNREAFASFTDQAIIVRLTANRKSSINCRLFLRSPMKTTTGTENQQLILSGKTGSKSGINGSVRFQARVKAINDGGLVATNDTSISISGANTVTIYIAMGSNFVNYRNVGGDEVRKTESLLSAASRIPYLTARKNHVAFYQNQFNRVRFSLGPDKPDQKPTDERIRDFKDDHDLALIPLYYQFGRYLLISSSQPGSQAANLQGKWNDLTSPPWGGKYTININTEMNYWPAENTNLSELTEPLFSLIKDLSVTGRESARQMYGARGWMAHHNTDIWRISGQVDGAYYGIFPTGGAWLTEHLWEHYLYTGDKLFLSEIYPVLKGASMYFVDALQKVDQGKYLAVSPSMSPENSFMKDDVVGPVSLTQGTTMDNQIVFELLSNTIAAGKVLKQDPQFLDTLTMIKSKLSPMRIGRYGQLQEWMDDLDKENDRHRHISQLFGLFPGKQISPYRQPELAEAARNTLISRGDVSTGWSMGWKVNFWARQLDGNHAYKLIKDQLKPAPEDKNSAQGGGTYKNLFDAHPPFQIDGNFGCTAGITEMLMQSYDGVIHLLPALPKDWVNGSITGIVARGGFVIDMDWKAGKITRLVIRSKLGGNCRLRLPDELRTLAGKKLPTAVGENTNPLFFVDKVQDPIIADRSKLSGLASMALPVYDLATVAGRSYELRP